MRDFVTALMGGTHCGWCFNKNDTFLEKRYPDDSTLIGKLYWKSIWWTDKHVPVWRLGEMWHWKFHKQR